MAVGVTGKGETGDRMTLKKTIASLIQNFSRKTILSKHTRRRERRERWKVTLKTLSYRKLLLGLRSSYKHRSKVQKTRLRGFLS